MPLPKIETPYDEGFHAYMIGRAVDSNPYGDTAKGDEFVRGWEMGNSSITRRKFMKSEKEKAAEDQFGAVSLAEQFVNGNREHVKSCIYAENVKNGVALTLRILEVLRGGQQPEGSTPATWRQFMYFMQSGTDFE